MRPRCRADFVVCRILVVFVLLRALCAGEDVVARIVFARARLVAKGSTVDELLVGDPHRVGRREVKKPVPGRRVVDGGDTCVGVEAVDDRCFDVLCAACLLPWFASRQSVTRW